MRGYTSLVVVVVPACVGRCLIRLLLRVVVRIRQAVALSRLALALEPVLYGLLSCLFDELCGLWVRLVSGVSGKVPLLSAFAAFHLRSKLAGGSAYDSCLPARARLSRASSGSLRFFEAEKERSSG